MNFHIDPEYEQTLSTEQKNILKAKAEREFAEDVREDIGRDSTTDPERLHSAEESFSSEEYQ